MTVIPLLRTETCTLDDGRVLNEGDEFTIRGTYDGGRYSFRYCWNGNEVTCFGPVGKHTARTRTFRARDIVTIHRKKIERT